MSFATTVVTMFLLATSITNAQQADLASLDSDGDSKVSVAEFQKYARAKLSGFDQIGKFAKSVDADGNGEISETEFSRRMSVLQKISAGNGADAAEDKSEKSKDLESKKESSEVVAAKSSFEKMKKLIGDNEWANAEKLMTTTGRDEVVVGQVVSSIGLTKMEMPMPIPQIEDTVDEIENVLAKYNLNDLGVDVSSMFKVEMDIDGMEEKHSKEEKEKEARKSMDDTGKKILAAVEKSGKRWEIVRDLWDAKKASPFSFSPLTGNVAKTESGEGVVYLEVSMAPATTDNNDGVQIQMMSPPTIIRMKKTKDSWLFDGRDEKRTMKAVEEFMENNRGMMGGPEVDRHDF